MTELTLVDYFVMGEAVGIVSTFIVSLYYSRKQMQKLSTDIESKILNDLADKMHNLVEVGITRPELHEIFVRDAGAQTPKEAAAFYTLSVFAYALHMHQRGILRKNEWNGWLRIINVAFEEGTIGDYWKESELGKWFDPDFEDFINNEIVPKTSPKQQI
jgi:hypothetical protein